MKILALGSGFIGVVLLVLAYLSGEADRPTNIADISEGAACMALMGVLLLGISISLFERRKDRY